MKKTSTQPTRGVRRQFQGEVVSDKGMKTIHVLVKTTKIHPKYRKQYSVSKKYAVHDENGQAHLGDMVYFVETRPISKTKRWRLMGILKKASE